MSAEVIMAGALSVQVCVPDDWPDEAVKTFAEQQYPCGTSVGWRIRTDAERLAGNTERNPCAQRGGYVHIMLDA